MDFLFGNRRSSIFRSQTQHQSDVVSAQERPRSFSITSVPNSTPFVPKIMTSYSLRRPSEAQVSIKPSPLNETLFLNVNEVDDDERDTISGSDTESMDDIEHGPPIEDDLPPELAAITVSGRIRVGNSDKSSRPPKSEQGSDMPSTLLDGDTLDIVELKAHQVLESHPRRPITSICLSEGRLFAGTREGVIIEWDISTGSYNGILAGHTKSITSLAAGSGRLFSGSEDGMVRSWLIETGQNLKTFNAHVGYVTAVCVTAEGRLYTGGADRAINEWNPNTCRRIWALNGHERWILCLASSDGKLYSGGNDHTIRIWDTSNGRCLKVLEGHNDWVYSLAISPKSNVLYSSSRDGTVKIWNTNTGTCSATLSGHDGNSVRAVAVAPGSKRLFSAGDDKTIIEWDTETRRPVRSMLGHLGAVSSLICAPTGLLYSGSGDCYVRVWEIGSSPHSNSNINTSVSLSDSPSQNRILSTRLPARPSSIDEDFETEIIILREQLAKAQDLVNKQNRVKLSMMEELTSARMELANARSELADAQAGLARLELLENEREQLLKSRAEFEEVQEEVYQEAEMMVEAKVKENALLFETLTALSKYMQKNADQQYLQIEVDVAAIRSLLEHPHTPLHHYNQSNNLAEFYHPQSWKRTWELDSDWDSDVEVDEEQAWWRHENPYDIKAKNKNPAVSYFQKIANSDIFDDTASNSSNISRKGSVILDKPRNKFELPPVSDVPHSLFETNNELSSAKLFPRTPRIPSFTAENDRSQSPLATAKRTQGNDITGGGSWFRPFRNLVESTLEQLVAPNITQPRLNLEKERELREQRDRELREALEREMTTFEPQEAKAPRVVKTLNRQLSVKTNETSVSSAEQLRKEREKQDSELRDRIARESTGQDEISTSNKRIRHPRQNERELREKRDKELRDSILNAAAEVESVTKHRVAKAPSVTTGSVFDLTDTESVSSSKYGGPKRAAPDDDSKSMRSMKSGISNFSATSVGVRAGGPRNSVGNFGVGSIGVMGAMSQGMKPVSVDNRIIKVGGLVPEPLPDLMDITLDDIDDDDSDEDEIENLPDITPPIYQNQNLESFGVKLSSSPPPMDENVKSAYAFEVPRYQPVSAQVAPAYMISQKDFDDEGVTGDFFDKGTFGRDAKEQSGEKDWKRKGKRPSNLVIAGSPPADFEKSKTNDQKVYPVKQSYKSHRDMNFEPQSVEEVSTIERMATAVENAIDHAIENPWNLLPAWLRSTKVPQEPTSNQEKMPVERTLQHSSDLENLTPFRIPSKTAKSNNELKQSNSLQSNVETPLERSQHQRRNSITFINQVLSSAFEVVSPEMTTLQQISEGTDSGTESEITGADDSFRAQDSGVELSPHEQLYTNPILSNDLIKFDMDGEPDAIQILEFDSTSFTRPMVPVVLPDTESIVVPPEVTENSAP